MPAPENDLLREVAEYYGAKLLAHGETPQGVDWNGEAGQIARFEQLFKLFEGEKSYSLNDLGCGYGAMLEHLRERCGDAVRYCGIDVSAEMVTAARRRHADDANARFVCAAAPDGIADYGLASGIFNVRQQRSADEWADYVEATIAELNRTSTKGFAFNCLTSYSDEEKKKDYLFYADPLHFFDLCKRRYSRHVALLHDYGLYEFTLVVRKLP